MLGLKDLANEGKDLIQNIMFAQLTDLLSTRDSAKSAASPKTPHLKSIEGQQEVLRIHVDGTRNLTLKKTKSRDIFAKLTLVGDHSWYCEGKTKAQILDPTNGKCNWDECIEFSRINEYTELKISIGFNKRFGRFKMLACTRLPLSSILRLTKPQWFLLYTDKKLKQQCGGIKLSFELPSKKPQVSSDSASIAQTIKARPEEASNNAICSDYLLNRVSELSAQVEERDQRIKSMQSYIDKMLARVLQKCPEILEK